MDNMTRLYREDYPDGLLFLPNEINIAKAQGWRNNIEDKIAKPVPEMKQNDLCACGCGKKVPIGKKFFPFHGTTGKRGRWEVKNGNR